MNCMLDNILGLVDRFDEIGSKSDNRVIGFKLKPVRRVDLENETGLRNWFENLNRFDKLV